MSDLIPSIEYGWLAGEQLGVLEPILAKRGWASLNKLTSRALCAFAPNGQLLGFLVVQLFPHTEPLYVDPDYRGIGIAEELSDRMVKYMLEIKARGWMVVADSPHAVKLCEERGMRKLESPVYVTG